MLDTLLEYAAIIDQYLWGWWTMAFIASVAVYLTIRSGFFQLRKCTFIAKNTVGKIFDRSQRTGKGSMSPFQATATALASTVGMGNMAGVATALSVGGPGAIFWMWVLALLGMMSKTAEITLAVHYREVGKDGRFRGGPMYYINKGLGWKRLATLFSIGVLINAMLSASLLQSHTVGRAFLQSYHFDPYLVTGLMAIITAVVAIGGIRRIGRFSEALVPLMSLIYLLCGIVIFFVNYEKIPEVFSMIFRYAFAPAPAAGGFIGAGVAAAIKNGMAKGMLSNEAGLGTAPMVHATANTTHPFRQGIWGAFEVFFDTIVVCTITSFAILSTGVFHSSEQSGIELVIDAFSSVFHPDVAGGLISFSILTFCLTTQIGFFIYFETSMVNVFGKTTTNYLKWLYFIPAVVFAGVSDVDQLWVFANISVAVCAIPNLIAIVALRGAFFTLMDDSLSNRNVYTTQKIDHTSNYVKKAPDG